MDDKIQGTSLMAIPRRTSLVAQAVEILHREMRDGVWRDSLPGERDLCERLQVSRITVRTALDQLRREGLIEVSKGRRSRILMQPPLPSAGEDSRVVGLLSATDYHQLSSFALYLIGALHSRLQNSGYRLEVYAHASYNGRRWEKELEKAVARVRARCWVVFGGLSSAETWFLEHKLRTIVVGQVQSRTKLPSLGADYQAAARHAVSTFTTKGHRKVALLMPRSRGAECDPYVTGFLEGHQAGAQREAARTLVTQHDGTADGIYTVLKRLLCSSSPPTGLLVARPKYALTAITGATELGFHVPKDVSVVALGYDPFLDFVRPSIAHYEISWPAFARRLNRTVMHMVTEGLIRAERTLVVPEFRTGESLAIRP